MLDIIYKPYGHVLDFGFASNYSQLYVLEQNAREDNPHEAPRISLYFKDTSVLNTDRDVHPIQRKFRATQETQPLEPLPRVPIDRSNPK